MASREEAIKLAYSDTPAAWACARQIDEPWYKCQALAWTARFAPESDFIQIVEEALAAATQGRDAYQRASVMAWPIRALIEGGEFERAESATQSALKLAEDIEHPGARAEALINLLQATLPGGQPTWRSVLHAIIEIPQSERLHWRHRRALVHAVEYIRRKDPVLADQVCARVTEEKARRQINSRVHCTARPRDYFF